MIEAYWDFPSCLGAGLDLLQCRIIDLEIVAFGLDTSSNNTDSANHVIIGVYNPGLASKDAVATESEF
jgi:hypothetical protein